ncbi:XRE family transcriptional regulator [Periweissella cryptocerci]|uniref:XRE family transcriptional regulator n=1 Tax=Periweissella cryptocerci TaxID=2506420 RepID=A0A4P6YTQ5_9LACO|nr:helix-turn-helix transcriptional regulator [Periweissella cryptocerci]QBO36144.1 XRE family transcriptional regulator [Periweissella cryptocerci]
MDIFDKFENISLSELSYISGGSLGENMRLIRNALTLTQEQFGEEIDVDQALLSKYERGIREPSIDLVVTISQVVNISLDVLVLGDRTSILLALNDASVGFQSFL